MDGQPEPERRGLSFTGAPGLAGCLGVPAQIVGVLPPEINSGQMSDKSGTVQVQQSISIFPSARFAQEEYDAFPSRKAPGCLQTLLNSSLTGSSGSGAGADAMSVTKTASPKGTTALDVDTALTDEGATVPSRAELVFFVRGQFGDSLELMSTGSPATPSSLVRHLISVARSRL